MKFTAFKVQGNLNYGIFQELEKKYYTFGSMKLSKEYKNILDFIENHTQEDFDKIGYYCSVGFPDSIPFFKEGEVKLEAPISEPRHNLLCVGLNYADHVTEFIKDSEIPKIPVFFSKRALKIVGPEGCIDNRGHWTNELDYECELAVIIGRQGKDIPEELAEEYIFGYSVGNDLTARDLQRDHKQWFKGKSLDTLTAMGPYIVHKSSLPLPLKLEIKSFINGEMRQNSNTENLIFNIPKLISTLSKGMTLVPGDIILTGTPRGVGMGFKPPKFLKPGDSIECFIEKIGTLKNRVL